MSARHFRSIVFVALLASTMGCARSVQSAGTATAVQEVATARITNNGWLDVNVYASRSGMRLRLGTVTGQRTEVFRIPRSLIDAPGLTILIDPIGSPQSYQTDLIPVGPGQQIDVVVQQRLAMSHYSVLSR
jgi:hypothetical protein